MIPRRAKQSKTEVVASGVTALTLSYLCLSCHSALKKGASSSLNCR